MISLLNASTIIQQSIRMIWQLQHLKYHLYFYKKLPAHKQIIAIKQKVP